MQLTNTGVYRIPPESDPSTKLKDTPVTRILRAEHDLHCDYMVDVFDHADGRQAVMLTNYHFAYSQWPTVEFAAEIADITEIDKWSGGKFACTTVVLTWRACRFR